MTIDEFIDFYTEESFAIRDAEVQMNLQIGQALIGMSDEELGKYAKVIKRHLSYLKTCIEVFKKWDELEKSYTKEKSWSDLVKLAGIEKEKRPRKSLKDLGSLIYERGLKHMNEYENTKDPYIKGKWDEDKELLDENYNTKTKNCKRKRHNMVFVN